MFNLWNQIWSKPIPLFHPRSGNHFYPTLFFTPIFLCSLLSGNCTLNKFLFKIKRKPSPLCYCLSGEEEDVSRVIFVCTKYNASREVLIACVTKLNLLWRIPLKAFPEHRSLWSTLTSFLSLTKRFKLQP